MQVGSYVLIGLIVAACVLYYIYSRTKRPNSDIQIEKGNELVKKKEYDDAILCYEKAIKFGKYKKASKLTALNNICLCYIYKNDMEKAEEYAKQCMELSSTDTASRLMFGRILYNKQQFNEAIEFYKTYLSNNSDSASGWSMLAMSYAQLGFENEANEAANKAIENHFNGASQLRNEVKGALKSAKAIKKKLSDEQTESVAEDLQEEEEAADDVKDGNKNE